MKISFIGSGAWASALACVLAGKMGNEVTLYGRSKAEVDDVNLNHVNSKYFPDVSLPFSIKATLDPKEALRDRDLLVLAVPSSQLGNIVELLKENLNNKPLLVNVIKGFDLKTGEGISSTLSKCFGDYVSGIVSLVGPSFAKDVIHGDVTCICAVSSSLSDAEKVQSIFSTPSFRVYTNLDVIGAEVGAGMKNIIAIASGILNGLGYSDNARASLITRGLAEITRFGVACGASERTFLGLTGVGDLFLTCSSFSSRNYSFGYEIGKKDEAAEVIRSNTKTIEGMDAAKAIHEFAKARRVEVPITDAVYSILFEGKKPSLIAKALMSRELKAE